MRFISWFIGSVWVSGSFIACYSSLSNTHWLNLLWSLELVRQNLYTELILSFATFCHICFFVKDATLKLLSIIAIGNNQHNNKSMTLPQFYGHEVKTD